MRRVREHRRCHSGRTPGRYLTMQPFTYTTADDSAAAIRVAAADPKARYLAGGTTLVDLMKLDVEQPTRLIDVTGLPLTEVELLGDGTLRVGAMVRNSDLAHHEL